MQALRVAGANSRVNSCSLLTMVTVQADLMYDVVGAVDVINRIQQFSSGH